MSTAGPSAAGPSAAGTSAAGTPATRTTAAKTIGASAAGPSAAGLSAAGTIALTSRLLASDGWSPRRTTTLTASTAPIARLAAAASLVAGPSAPILRRIGIARQHPARAGRRCRPAAALFARVALSPAAAAAAAAAAEVCLDQRSEATRLPRPALAESSRPAASAGTATAPALAAASTTLAATSTTLAASALAAASAPLATATTGRTGLRLIINQVVELAHLGRAARLLLPAEHAHQPHAIDAIGHRLQRLDEPRQPITC
jgi:hypothetical protein